MTISGSILAHGHAFASERPLRDAQVSALQQLAVGRDDVSDGQRHDVAHDKLFGRNLPLAGTDILSSINYLNG